MGNGLDPHCIRARPDLKSRSRLEEVLDESLDSASASKPSATKYLDPTVQKQRRCVSRNRELCSLVAVAGTSTTLVRSPDKAQCGGTGETCRSCAWPWQPAALGVAAGTHPAPISHSWEEEVCEMGSPAWSPEPQHAVAIIPLPIDDRPVPLLFAATACPGSGAESAASAGNSSPTSAAALLHAPAAVIAAAVRSEVATGSSSRELVPGAAAQAEADGSSAHLE